ncbi:hypothetical protein BDBG_00428 [Blastomyces gilchristii SLH14081]|uniref:Uncharacterized protein n=1 Tax=Blastomyces gilchristii (strain SLH14081) TaxID=559298 RepID=A0A179U7E3_BLAGS|nr:uncharacterized protein BDBG_00428 [Blastomyces gilchristii SLH14081]OAT03740.1 hypothetical protein BDBG_00428 [Blastomyces gilchristii SLH14081]
MYQNILVTHVPIYRAVFEHIQDFPDQPFFFHCTLQLEKIGLGVLSALILRTAGYSPDTIVHDYVHVLARVGFEPIRESLYNELIGKKDRDEVTTRSILAAGGISYKAMVQFLGFMEKEFENWGGGVFGASWGFQVRILIRSCELEGLGESNSRSKKAPSSLLLCSDIQVECVWRCILY